MTRLIAWFAVTAIVLLAVGAAFAPASGAGRTQPLATMQAVQTAQASGEGDADAPTPTPEDEEGDRGSSGRQPGADRPEGVPSDAVEAEVTGHVDGDKFTIRQGGESHEVLLIGVDAPEVDEGLLGECYAEEAAEALEELVPEGETVWLERDEDDTDNRDRLLRFVWIDDDGDGVLVNEVMLREGYGSFQPREQNASRDDELGDAEEQARDDDEGLWGECGGNHVEVTPEPTATPTFEEVVAEHAPLADVRELAIRPGDLFGEKIAFSGTVLTIMVAPPDRVFRLGDADEEDYTVQMQVNVLALDGTLETVFVGYNGDTAGIFEGSFVTVYGTVVDT